MSYNGYASSPDERPPRGYQIAPLKGFLPLNDEVTLSTRGQNLPSLIRRNRSGASLSTLDKHERRTSASASPQLHKSRGSDDLEAGIIIGGAWTTGELMERRLSSGMPAAMMTPQMRSQRLIGNSNPRYKWERYWKGEEELKMMKKPIREYYMRCNSLIQHYTFIDRLLDSSLPHNLIQEYHEGVDIPPTIEEESGYTSPNGDLDAVTGLSPVGSAHNVRKVKRTPKNLYKVPEEDTPLLQQPESEPADDDFDPQGSLMPAYTPEEDIDSGSSIVTIAIYLNLVANTVLLILKIIVTIMTSSVSVLASLVDAALDFLSTAIVWTTTRLIASHDLYAYPIGRRRLEPVGVLVFSVIMVTSFFQVALEGFKKMSSGDHTIVQLSIPAIAIMASTVVIKFACWLWCRLIKNSSVQALAQDAMTDVVFNIFSIIFPLSMLSSSKFPFNIFSNQAQNSRLLRLYLVARSFGRYLPLLLRHLQLVSNLDRAHP